MPPMYINIGAYVGEGTLVDSHALVGSCAQIGARVHLSAGAQIGGVIEPVGAMPVIDRRRRAGRRQHRHLRRRGDQARAVIAAGTVLTGSTPVYDLVHGRIIKPEPGQPLVIPEGAVVVPGARVGDGRRGQGLGPVAGHAGHRQVPRRQDRHAHGAGTSGSGRRRRAGAHAHRHRVDDRPRRAGGAALAGRVPARPWLFGARAAARGRPLQRHRRGRRAASWPVSTHFDCVPPFFPSRVEGGILHGRGACDAKGILAAQVAAAERLRARRRDAGRPGVRGRRGAGQRRRQGRQHASPRRPGS